jgi:hypothetical protein
MNTTATPETVDPEERQSRRTEWLIVALLLPTMLVPTITMLVLFGLGASFAQIWDGARWALLATLTVTMAAGIAVLVLRRWSAWFGVPNMLTPADEREWAIRGQAIARSWVTICALLLANIVLRQDMWSMLILLIGETVFYLSLLRLSHRV